MPSAGLCLIRGRNPPRTLHGLDGTAAMLPLAFLVPLVRPSRRDAGRQARNLLPSGAMATTSVFHGVCGIFLIGCLPSQLRRGPFELESRELCRPHSRQRRGLSRTWFDVVAYRCRYL
jgi:hypothetical protein